MKPVFLFSLVFSILYSCNRENNELPKDPQYYLTKNPWKKKSYEFITYDKKVVVYKSVDTSYNDDVYLNFTQDKIVRYGLLSMPTFEGTGNWNIQDHSLTSDLPHIYMSYFLDKNKIIKLDDNELILESDSILTSQSNILLPPYQSVRRLNFVH